MGKQVHRTAHSDQNNRNNRSKNNKKKMNIPMIVMSGINVFFTLLLTWFIISLHIIPAKFIVIIVCILLVFDLLVFFLLKRRKIGFQILGFILSVLLIVMNSVGIYYISKTNNFLNKAFNNAPSTYTSTYYVVTKANSTVTQLQDLNDGVVGYYASIPNVEVALKEVTSKVTIKTKGYDDIASNYNELRRNVIDATIIEQSVYEALIDAENGIIKKNDYKIIDTFDIEVEEEKEEIIDDGNSFSIYIGGVDFTEKNTDFNMVVTINTKTHKILLTSIPRDYYVTVNGMHELLGYVGYSGINTSRKAMENLFGINIGYYMKIDTNSIVGLVDTLGGVQFCNNGKEFITTHAVVQGTYDDTKGEKLTVPNGCRTYNGIQILTIVRERHAFADGDRQRQKNCQQVMINIFKKMASAGTITNYSSVLNAVSDLYTTNISRDMITDIANDTISGASWTFEQQSVTGYDSNGYVHMGTVKDYVMRPNEDSVNAAIRNIKNIQAGK